MSETATQREDYAAAAKVVLPPISIDTLTFCLTRLNGKDASVPGDDELHADVVSAEQLVEQARNHGWDASLVHRGWPELRASLTVGPALLILKNGNVILATANNVDPAAEEIIVCDPLYCDGADFFLPRDALESAWGGVALAVKPLSPPRKPLVPWLARFSAGMILTGPLVLCPTEASVDQSPASLFTSTQSTETKVSQPEMEQVSAGSASSPLGSASALLLVTEALNPVRKQEMNASDEGVGNTQPVKIEADGSPQLNPAVAADVSWTRHLTVPPRQEVTVLRGAGTRH